MRDLSSLSPTFWERVFGSGTRAAEPKRIGVGMIGANYRVGLSSPDPNVPKSVVVKLPSPEPESRAAGISHRTYEREAKFYMHLASRVDIRRPHCHWVEFDEDTHDFVLVLEDLAPSEPGDQLTGCTIEQARLAVVELAGLHGPMWADPKLFDIDWLQRRADTAAAELLGGAYSMLMVPFMATYAKYFTPAQETVAREFSDRIVGWVLDRPGPLTLAHGDYRLDNMLFATAAGGPAVAVVDWQTPNHAPGANDVAYFLGAGVMPEVRREIERDVIADYLTALRRYGVDHDATSFWNEYVHASFAGLIMAVVASQVVTPTERGEAMFAAMATRAAQHAVDLGALDVL